jgi:5-methyltetrahydropteroyltriglutamate--homocysteine methyltransferase
VRKAYAPLAEEASFLRALGTFPFKLTLPAPSYFYMSDFVPILPGSEYKSRQEFVDDVVEIEQRLIAEAIAAGARWIQLDFPLYPALVDDLYVAKLDAKMNSVELLDRAIAADRKVVEHVPPGVTLGLHLCRGNIIGGFWSGSLEPVAERMFNELPFHRFLVEWEDVTREGDYSALKYVPKGTIVALGLVSTKTALVEADDDVVSRLEEASQYLGLEQLALSSQCGFASFYAYSNIQAEAAQWQKLELIGRVADRVWGSG